MHPICKAACVALAALVGGMAYGQDDTPIPNINSPYSMYGFGTIADQATAMGKGMGGVGYALQDGSSINLKNPASYASIDSLTMLIDAGMSVYMTNLSDGTSSVNAKNAAFDYVALQFRLCKRLGLAIAYLPFSKVGYDFSTTARVNNAGAPDVDFGTNTYNYGGTGGLQQAMLGLGARPFGGLSVGVNASFIHGSINRSLTVASSNASSYGFTQTEAIKVKDYKLDFGLQYALDFKDKHTVVAGITYSLGHRLNSEANIGYVKNSSSTVVSYDERRISGEIYLPHVIGAGLSYVYDDRLTVAADYTMQRWGDNLFLGNSTLRNRSIYALGAEYVHDARSKRYLSTVRYRLGAYYSDPYVRINGMDGAREYGVSLGFGFPILQNKSLVQVSGQYVKVSSLGDGIGLDESMFKLNIGITFNERWFMKMKVR